VQWIVFVFCKNVRTLDEIMRNKQSTDLNKHYNINQKDEDT